MTITAGLAVLPLVGATTGHAVIVAAPAAATFTHNVRADAAEKGGGQNEPQVTVDQAGVAYVGWQGSTGDGASAVSRTADGVHFTYLGNADPGAGDNGDTALATTSWTGPTEKLAAPLPGSAVFFSVLGAAQAMTCPEGQINIRGSYTVDQGKSWKATDATCQPLQVDRNWVAAYTEPQYRGTPQARDHTWVYQEYHDFGESMIWVSVSSDGGSTWDTLGQHPAEQVGADIVSNACNTTPGGIAVDQRGPHAGRVYVAWTTSDAARNLAQGCNYTEAEPFDHVFVSWSDDHGVTWTTHAAWNDPCSPNPPLPPSNPTACGDDQEIFTPIAVDDAGNVFVAFVDRPDSRTAAAGAPEFDIGVAWSTDGGDSWSGGAPDNPGTPRIANTDTGTHYFPWIAAGGDGAVDVVWYGTPFVEGMSAQQKPTPAPGSAEWNVDMGQSLDVVHGAPFTQSRVSDHPNAYGDICTIGIFCDHNAAPVLLGTGGDRILLDDMGVAIGPDGGARVAWTDSRDTWSATCHPGGNNDSNVPCQTAKEHVYFACQKSGTGLHGEVVTGCGRSLYSAASTSASPPVPQPPATRAPAAPVALPNTAGGAGAAGAGSFAVVLLACAVRRRRRS